jgi:hypothetical protein
LVIDGGRPETNTLVIDESSASESAMMPMAKIQAQKTKYLREWPVPVEKIKCKPAKKVLGGVGVQVGVGGRQAFDWTAQPCGRHATSEAQPAISRLSTCAFKIIPISA